jgi:poly [ADP-ribose] polymerase
MSRANLTAAIKARGGDVAGTVSGKVTHLISTDAEVQGQTSKVILAQGKGLPIVSEDFLDACKKNKKVVASKKYEIGAASSSSSSTAKAKKAVPKAKKAAPKAKKTAKAKKAAKATASVNDDGPAVHPKVPAKYADDCGVFVDEGDNVYDAELNQQEASSNTDKFYVMQLLKEDDSNFCLFQHWGRTGTTGQIKTDEFDDEEAAIADFEKKFKMKTGCKWEDRDQFQQKTNKYNYLAKDYNLTRDEDVLWQYHLTNDPYSKPDGWYGYDGDSTTEDSATYNMENYHEQFVNNSWLSIRFVQSGNYTYKVDFDKMEQTNTTSQKTRPIRRHHD